MSKPAFQPLVNLGGSNFCFMNAIIQVCLSFYLGYQNLWNIKEFKNTLIGGLIPHQSSTLCQSFLVQIKEVESAHVFTVLLEYILMIIFHLQEFMILYDQQTQLTPLSAMDFRNSLAEHYNTRANDMEDSYEVFVWALVFL